MISTPYVAVPPRDYGGTELVVYELVEGLSERGHDVSLFATGDSQTRAELHYLYEGALWPPGVMPEFNHVSWAMREIAAGDYELIHAHGAGALAFARLLPSIPLVYTLHHVRDEDLSAYYRFFPDPWYVAISADQAGREEPVPRLQIIHHGLEPGMFECVDSPADYVCFVGRFSEIKGPHTAIDVAAMAGVPIRVAGDVHHVDREFGEREMRHRLQQPHVTYLGAVGMDRKVPLLRDARALLAPIQWNEPFGLILIEAMLSGCPVIAHSWGSVPELVEPGVTGFIARDAAEMAALIRPGGGVDQFDRRRCRERAAARFSRARMVADHERLYQRAIAISAEGRRSIAPTPDGPAAAPAA